MNRYAVVCSASLLVVLCVAAVGRSQPGSPGSELPALAPGVSAAPSASTPAMDAERAKIWNSPKMLRARAWVQEYCQRSARITPAEAQTYMTELENMTPVQMKLWLLKFDAEEEMIQQQQAAFNQSRMGGVHAAMGVQRQTQQAYAAINRDETKAAEGEQQSINTQSDLAAQREMQQVHDKDSMIQSEYSQPFYMGGYPWGGGYGLGGYGGYGGYHVHYHVHQ